MLDIQNEILKLTADFTKKMKVLAAMQAVNWESVSVDTLIYAADDLDFLLKVPSLTERVQGGAIGYFNKIHTDGYVYLYRGGTTSQTTKLVSGCTDSYKYSIPASDFKKALGLM